MTTSFYFKMARKYFRDIFLSTHRFFQSKILSYLSPLVALVCEWVGNLANARQLLHHLFSNEATKFDTST